MAVNAANTDVSKKKTYLFTGYIDKKGKQTGNFRPLLQQFFMPKSLLKVLSLGYRFSAVFMAINIITA